MTGSWETSGEFRAKLREVFDKMDVNKDGTVDEEERAKSSGLLNELHMEFGLRAEVVFESAMTFDDFEAGFVREWEVTSKEQALAEVNVSRAVAEMLAGGSPEMPLKLLEDMSEEELRQFCVTSVAAKVEKLLRLHQEMLKKRRGRGDENSGAEKGNSKFAQGGGGELRTAVYGKLEDFSKGLVEAIGLPDHRLKDAMMREHCKGGDSTETFSPGNYDTTTTPAAEWLVVTDPEEGKRVSNLSEGKRRVRAIEDLRQDDVAKQAGLLEEEILAMQLYTGVLLDLWDVSLKSCM